MHPHLDPYVRAREVYRRVAHPAQKDNIDILGCFENIVYFYSLLLFCFPMNEWQSQLFSIEFEDFGPVTEYKDLIAKVAMLL